MPGATFTYDDAGRRVRHILSGTLVPEYAYNGRGERVARIITPSPVNDQIMVYDEAGRLIGEYLKNGNRIREIVWLDDVPVAVLGNHGGSTHQYVLTDRLGTPRAIVHPGTNAILWRWDLTASAFGDHAANQDPDGDGAAYTFNLRYPGQYYDVETGLHYNYFRDYDPSTGRYVQSDPIGLAGGVSTFGYAGGNALSYFDPFGLLKWRNLGTTTTNDFNPPSNVPPPSPLYASGKAPAGAGAAVSADWEIRPKCIPQNNGFVLDDFEVDFRTSIHMREKYASTKQRSWVLRGEEDHILDYNNWAAGAGNRMAHAVENKIKTLAFDSECECQKASNATMFNHLGQSFDKAIEQTIRDHDKNFRHTWGHPNARP